MRLLMNCVLSGVVLSLVLIVGPTAAMSQSCGEVFTLNTHDGTTTKYAVSKTTGSAGVVIAILPGGGGFADLNAGGCAQELQGNSLVQAQQYFYDLGFITALIDAPSDHPAGDGLAGFRIDPAHAADIGAVIVDLRKRTGLPVWLAGTSRGSISAVNAASRLTGDAAPDGLVLTSSVVQGNDQGRKRWVAQTVFSAELDKITLPTLVMAHEGDKCARTPPSRAKSLFDAVQSPVKKLVMMTGGPGWRGPVGVKACRGKSPHGYFKQRIKMAEAITKFILGDAK